MEILSEIEKVLLGLWWVWGTFILGWAFMGLWIAWCQAVFKANIPWSLLEIKLPREAKRSPKAMEQILMNIWALRNSPGNLKEWYWDGEVTIWYSFEIASFGGEIHFYLRTCSRYVSIIKANFYGHYPDCEVIEVPDYLDRFPKTVPELHKNGYDIFGLEMHLAKNNAYPIRTYEYFESDEETLNIDPMAGLLEVLSKLKGEEVVMMQLVSRPSSDPQALQKLADAELDDLREKFAVKGKGKKAGQIEGEELFSTRTPGETELLKAVDEKSSKNAFEVVVRYVYLAPKDTFSVVLPYRGLRVSFQQFGLPNGNFFDVNYKTWTRAWFWDPPHIFPTKILAGRKARMWDYYRKRALPLKTFMGKAAQFHIFTSTFNHKSSLLNTEELATLWHLPTEAIMTQPILERIEAKKMGPPPGLPIYREGNSELPGIMK